MFHVRVNDSTSVQGFHVNVNVKDSLDVNVKRRAAMLKMMRWYGAWHITTSQGCTMLCQGPSLSRIRLPLNNFTCAQQIPLLFKSFYFCHFCSTNVTSAQQMLFLPHAATSVQQAVTSVRFAAAAWSVVDFLVIAPDVQSGAQATRHAPAKKTTEVNSNNIIIL